MLCLLGFYLYILPQLAEFMPLTVVSIFLSQFYGCGVSTAFDQRSGT
ncbi:hypothetical protein AT1219_20392 [Vibrio alginolyticus]